MYIPRIHTQRVHGWLFSPSFHSSGRNSREIDVKIDILNLDESASLLLQQNNKNKNVKKKNGKRTFKGAARS